MSALTFTLDPDGRPLARSDPASAIDAALAGFLTQDVPWAAYADRLAAADTVVTGNAYAVTFEANSVRIAHLHLPDAPVVCVPRARFLAALRAWAAFLRAEGPGR